MEAYMQFKNKSDIFSSLMASDSLALGVYSRDFLQVNTEQLTDSHLWLLAIEQFLANKTEGNVIFSEFKSV